MQVKNNLVHGTLLREKNNSKKKNVEKRQNIVFSDNTFYYLLFYLPRKSYIKKCTYLSTQRHWTIVGI